MNKVRIVPLFLTVIFFGLFPCVEPSVAESIDDAGNASYVKMYNRLQFLQDEVFRLQGVTEELRHELKKIKQQHLQDYVALDKRLSVIHQELKGKAVDPASGRPEKYSDKKIADANNVSDSYDQYKKAYSLIKEKKFDEAKSAFSEFIKQYPGDQLVANCYYWLGELYILEKEYPQAEKAFNTIVDTYPSHNKTPEAMYKLGRIYFDTGRQGMAKKQMELVLEKYHGKSTNAVRLANDFLKANF